MGMGDELSRRAFLSGSTIAVAPSHTPTLRSRTPSRRSRSPQLADGWPMLKYDAGHTGHPTQGRGPTTQPTLTWQFELSSNHWHDFVPLIAGNGLLYAGDIATNEFVALDLTSGNERWRHSRPERESDPNVIYDAVIDNQTVYVSWDEQIIAFNPKSGEKRWTRQTDSYFDVLLPANDQLFTVTTFDERPGSFEQPYLVALDQQTGTVQWRHAVPMGFRNFLFASPPLAFADGTLYMAVVSGDDGDSNDNTHSLGGKRPWRLSAHDPASGTDKWIQEIVGRRVDEPILTVADGQVYFGTGFEPFYAIDTETGTVRWRYKETSTWTSWTASPAVGNRRVYTHIRSPHRIVALDTQTGTQQWVMDDLQLESANSPRHLVLVERTLYVAESNTVLALDARSGEKRFRCGRDIDGRAGNAPIVVDGTLFATFGGSVCAFTESG